MTIDAARREFTAVLPRVVEVTPNMAPNVPMQMVLDQAKPVNRLVPMRDDVLDVHVNGAPAGVRLWDPYTIEVTDLVREGENEISLSVTNTLVNLLSGTPRPSGMAGPPSLVPHASFTFELGAVAASEAKDG